MGSGERGINAGSVRAKTVAHLLGKDVDREDCLAPSLGIDSPEIAMMDELGGSKAFDLTKVS